MISSTLLNRLRKLQGLPPGVLAQVLGYKIERMVRSIRQHIRIRSLGDTMPRGVNIPANGRLRSSIRFFALSDGNSKREELLRILEEELQISLTSIYTKAEEVCTHKFDLLGSGLV